MAKAVTRSCLLMFLAAAAQPALAHAQAPQFRDSAGIRIVENPESAVPPAGRWVVARQPRVQIGVLDGAEPYVLSGVRAGAVLPDGRIVITTQRPVQARVYDPNGRHLTTFGREGEGPGEFSERISSVTLAGGDTLGLGNGTLGVNLFSTDGAFLGTVAGPLPSGVRGAGSADWLGGRRFLLRLNRPAPPASTPDGAYAVPLSIALWSSGTPRVDTLGTFAWTMQYRMRGAPVEPFPSLVLPGAFGRRLYDAANAQRVWVGDNITGSIAVYAPDGRQTHIIRRQHRPLPVTAADREAALERVRDNAIFRAPLPPDVRRHLERQAASMPIPDAHPVFTDLIADQLGSLWARRPAHVGAAMDSWDVFGPDGVLQATVDVPSVARVLHIGRSHILAVVLDEFDVEYVRLYELRR
jgi:hypothetical protein